MLLVKYHPEIANEIRFRFCQQVEFRFKNFKLELQPHIPCDRQEVGRYNYLEANQLELLFVFDNRNAQPWLKHIRFCKVKAGVEDDRSWQGVKVGNDETKLEERKDSGRYIKIAKLARMLNCLENAKKIEISSLGRYKYSTDFGPTAVGWFGEVEEVILGLNYLNEPFCSLRAVVAIYSLETQLLSLAIRPGKKGLPAKIESRPSADEVIELFREDGAYMGPIMST